MSKNKYLTEREVLLRNGFEPEKVVMIHFGMPLSRGYMLIKDWERVKKIHRHLTRRAYKYGRIENAVGDYLEAGR